MRLHESFDLGSQYVLSRSSHPLALVESNKGEVLTFLRAVRRLFELVLMLFPDRRVETCGFSIVRVEAPHPPFQK